VSRLALVLALATLVALPAYAGEFYVNLASQILIAAIVAMSLNLLVGYGGLTSLGHASFVGFAAYAYAWLATRLGVGNGLAALFALAATTALACVFGLIALRATGLGFLMITLALSQILWALAYRWVSITNGDNGLSGITRLAPFGVSLDSPAAFYWMTLAVSILGVVAMATFVSSAFGATLRGVRDEPRRMAALGHNVRLIRWITFVYAGFWGAVAGLLYVNYNKYIHPSSLSISSSAEGLLGVIAGGSGTVGGPIAGAALITILKNYSSAYIERWNMLLGFVFLGIVLIVPEGLLPGLWRLLASRGDGKQ
jgi:branched-chain amino acid transport system permease protein